MVNVCDMSNDGNRVGNVVENPALPLSASHFDGRVPAAPTLPVAASGCNTSVIVPAPQAVSALEVADEAREGNIE